MSFASGLDIQTGEHWNWKERREMAPQGSEGQSPFSTVHVDLPQSHKVQFKSTCLYKLLWASPKKYNFTSHHCKIQFIHKASKLLLSSWLTKAEQKSARQAEHQARHTQEKTLRLPRPTTFTSLCQSWSQCWLKHWYNNHIVWTPGSYCPLQTPYSISDGCFRWPKEEKPASRRPNKKKQRIVLYPERTYQLPKLLMCPISYPFTSSSISLLRAQNPFSINLSSQRTLQGKRMKENMY